MKRTLIALLFLLCTGITFSHAQNKVMILKPGDSLGNKVHLPRGNQGIYYTSDFEYNISAPPALVASRLPVNCDLVETANKSVNLFQSTHLYNGYVDLGRDFLDMGYTWTHDMDYDGASWTKMAKKDSAMKSKLMKTIFTDKLVQEAIYQWLSPAYLDAFSVMSVPEQKAYIKMFEEGISFADTFNIATQKQVVENSENYSTVVGSLNAFLYRRVVNKDLTRQDCMTWMNRILSDLRKNAIQNPTPADEFVITGYLGYEYYSATDYTQANGYGSEFNVLKRKDDEFEILPIPKFQIGNYGMPDTNFFYCFNHAMGYTHYLFYCDSTGWSFTKTDYDEDLKAYTFMGNGKSARVLMIYYYDFDGPESVEEYDNMNLTMAAIVDLDSGFIVQDSVGVPEYNYYNDWEDSYSEYPTLNKDRTVFYHYPTKGYGVMDRLGNVLLPPNYSSVELTDDPEIVKVNGKKLVSVHGGGKPLKKKKPK